MEQRHPCRGRRGFARKMSGGGLTGRAEACLTGILLGPSDQFSETLVGRARTRCDDIGRADHVADRRKVIERIGLLAHIGRDRERTGSRIEQRVAVGLGLFHQRSSDGCTPALAVFDHERLTQQARKGGRERADLVVGSPRRVGHDHTDGTIGIVLGLCGCALGERRCRSDNQERHQPTT